jgi:4-hydroxy-tetrahydrodipicolinate synthase
LERFSGIIVPMITPFTEDYKVDLEGLEWLVRFLEDSGVHGLFPASTTGEFVHLTREERDLVVERVIEAHRYTPVLPGVTANSTLEAIELARKYVDLGADGVIAAPPYYFKPRREGLLRHFSMLAEKVDSPILIYNIPSLTGNPVDVDLLLELASEYSNVVGVKITYPDLTYLRRVIIELKSLDREFSILTGIADLLLPNLMAGGDGGIVALANFAPKLLIELYNTYMENDCHTAVKVWRRILELSALYDIAETPVVVKEALHMIYGKIKPVVRPPLLPLDTGRRGKVRDLLAQEGLLSQA